MLEVNYKFKKDFLYVVLNGIINRQSTFELIGSIRELIIINGIKNVFINIEKVIVYKESYIKYIIEYITDINDYNFIY